ncbi:MAG TPA: hypothetical protein DEQ74_03030 [Wolbachia sp.]|jgi:hypothetical protein|uniref:ankyrin repeat domain-containing protein n=1 Tax=Wolbachia endosymbiont of Pentalonia nigronervosa TaxID=1301914 RepID=UPI000EC35F92|nr:ankyrin repeat domain-containing protein [Wolbachia endosymbiont of Pentalonia nigronervosa]MBD0391044.1 ankyrin repeat domain-containing protein [Wolbachia endosymbiont of Pentalonia nigronervosa]HCE59776.1 hypothetical protein [Wolbachia sp.]
MRSKEWKRILGKINVAEGKNIIGTIKVTLNTEHRDIYIKWRGTFFNINYLFQIRNVYINNESTLLHISAYYGLGNVVDALLAVEGININAVDNIYRATPLHWATVFGHIDIVKTLLAVEGININAVDQDETTPLHWATTYNRLNIVNALLEKGAEVNVVDKHKVTPLHLAAMSDNADLVGALLKKDANPFLKNGNGYTPRDLTRDDDVKRLLKATERKLLLKLTIVGNIVALAAFGGIAMTIWYAAEGKIIAGVISMVLTITTIVVGVLTISIIAHEKLHHGVNQHRIYQPSTDQPGISQPAPSMMINEMQTGRSGEMEERTSFSSYTRVAQVLSSRF